ncbi:hypothetical protein Q8A67_011135 [Cirrhinus molitorella]|uniref:Uncharacterized protein n=1 Tax=Cirrhinus molitorella TaxID=172907 RepID=A0AA88TPA5_9TELE|nr:hypothetical protein Q8A67_011135 [Cirrhinus molitorella]
MFRICFHQKDERSNEAAGEREKDREKKEADDRHQDLQVVLVAMTVALCCGAVSSSHLALTIPCRSDESQPSIRYAVTHAIPATPSHMRSLLLMLLAYRCSDGEMRAGILHKDSYTSTQDKSTNALTDSSRPATRSSDSSCPMMNAPSMLGLYRGQCSPSIPSGEHPQSIHC